jgi:hypothetical protein
MLSTRVHTAKGCRADEPSTSAGQTSTAKMTVMGAIAIGCRCCSGPMRRSSKSCCMLFHFAGIRMYATQSFAHTDRTN